MAASAAMGRTCGRPGDVSDWEEEHVLQWASQQPRLKPDLLDFMQRHEIHGDALLDPELLDDETFRQEVSVGQRFALKKAVGVLKAQQPARPPAQSAKRELFPFVPTKHGHQKNLLAIEGRVRGPSQAQLTVDEPENEQYLNSTRVGECSGVQCQNDSDDSEVAEDESSSAETAPCKSSDEEPGEEPEEMLEEELEFDTKSNEGDGDHFDYDGGSGSSSDWTPKPWTVRSRATALYPRKQLCKRSRRSFRTESATAATSATNPIQADSPRGDTYRPLKSIKQEPQTAASTSDVATTATTTATSIGATARTIAITATSAKSLVLSIKERYEAIYEEFASALLRNRTPRGRLVNEVSWRNIRYFPAIWIDHTAADSCYHRLSELPCYILLSVVTRCATQCNRNASDGSTALPYHLLQRRGPRYLDWKSE
ncbi:hypothetical protein N9K47_00085 [bacterium]|nr:hypothetical protein [bacterium]